MDIFKILSRSTKPSNRSLNSKDGKQITLPSAGKSANPQLFHDAVPNSRGKKRKRGVAMVEQDADKAEETLNYFVPRTPKAKEHISKPDPPTEHQTPPPEAKELLDEAECRQILRAHQLKISLLPYKDTKANDKIKKARKAPKGEKDSGAQEIRQIYPQTLDSFTDLRSTYGISKKLGENLALQGYKIPTEVQMGSLPMLLKPEVAFGRSTDLSEDNISRLDLLTVAPTGNGKTLALLIPIIDEIIQRRRIYEEKTEHEIEAVIVAPTKELASQIVNEGKKLSLGTGVRVVGMRRHLKVAENSHARKQSGNLSEASSEDEIDGDDDKFHKTSQQPIVEADILVTTPLALLHALSTHTAKEYLPLPTVRNLVLDEADVLLDPLFRDQTLGIWNSFTHPDLRVTLWSATMGSNIEDLAMETIAARQARLNLPTPFKIIRLVVGLKDSAIPNITHRLIYAATEPGKLLALRQLLHPTTSSTEEVQALRPPFLVFTQTIPRAIALHSELLYDIPATAGGSSRIAVLHSDLSSRARAAVMTRFRNGEIWVLITNDLLSRGVDFRGINGVVNYDVPNSAASYIHRVGRTGRAGRDGGVAVTYYTKEDIPYVKSIANVIAISEKHAGKEPSEMSVKKWLLDALPTPSKEDKKKFKKGGVEARRPGREGKSKMLISTKSGYERKLEHNRKGAIEASKRRKKEARKELARW